MSFEYGIVNLPGEPGRGVWAAAVGRRGEVHTKSFRYGGKRSSDEALAAARAWRDQQMRNLTPLKIAEFCEHKRESNTSGVVGVTFSRPARQPEGIWQARLHRADQRPVVKTFAVKRHGFDTAFAKAVEARRLMVESIGDELYLRDDYARQVARAAGHVTSAAGRGGAPYGRSVRRPQQLQPCQRLRSETTVPRLPV